MLIAVDTNVLIDQALGEADVIDALDIIRKRIPKAQFVVLRTVIEELAWAAIYDSGSEAGGAASTALQCMTEWGYQPMDVLPVGRGITEQISRQLRAKRVVPDEEENDASIIAEAALIGCGMLLSSDGHMLDAQDHPQLLQVLRDADVAGDKLFIARPRTIARKFDNR